jgi:hypothetical protein
MVTGGGGTATAAAGGVPAAVSWTVFVVASVLLVGTAALLVLLHRGGRRPAGPLGRRPDALAPPSAGRPPGDATGAPGCTGRLVHDDLADFLEHPPGSPEPRGRALPMVHPGRVTVLRTEPGRDPVLWHDPVPPTPDAAEPAPGGSGASASGASGSGSGTGGADGEVVRLLGAMTGGALLLVAVAALVAALSAG